MIRQYKPDYCYNTALVFSFGTVYALGKNRIDDFVLKNGLTYIVTLFVTVISFRLFHEKWGKSIWFYEAVSLRFAAVVILVFMKIRLSNVFLNYLGDHVFSIYILQRIPMSILNGTTVSDDLYLYFLRSFIITLFISYYFDKYTAAIWKSIDAHLFPQKAIKEEPIS